jgi:hypothetical protein
MFYGNILLFVLYANIALFVVQNIVYNIDMLIDLLYC